MSQKIIIKKICAGYYEYSLNGRTVEVISHEPNPAYGDTHTMWVAAAKWVNDIYTDPLDTKREAVEAAKKILLSEDE